jgi:hypothetical protein
MVGISRVTLWRMVRDGNFPVPCRIGPITVRWRADEVETWMKALPLANARLIPNAKLAETEGYAANQQKREYPEAAWYIATTSNNRKRQRG